MTQTFPPVVRGTHPMHVGSPAQAGAQMPFSHFSQTAHWDVFLHFFGFAAADASTAVAGISVAAAALNAMRRSCRRETPAAAALARSSNEVPMTAYFRYSS
jgi:hypothetical protein